MHDPCPAFAFPPRPSSGGRRRVPLRFAAHARRPDGQSDTTPVQLQTPCGRACIGEYKPSVIDAKAASRFELGVQSDLRSERVEDGVGAAPPGATPIASGASHCSTRSPTWERAWRRPPQSAPRRWWSRRSAHPPRHLGSQASAPALRSLFLCSCACCVLRLCCSAWLLLRHGLKSFAGGRSAEATFRVACTLAQADDVCAAG